MCSPVAARAAPWGDLFPPNPKSQQKLSKKYGIKLVGYAFRLKKSPHPQRFLLNFSELALPLVFAMHLTARLESLPCAADFSDAHFKFQLRFQPRNFRKATKGNNRTIVLRHKYSRASNFDIGEIPRAFCKLSNLA